MGSSLTGRGSSLTDRGGEGSGFLFGTGTSIFADNAARDAYFTANPAQLTQYNNNEFLLIQVGTGFQRRQNNAWIVVTNIVTGPKGQKGDTGDKTRYYVADANITQTGNAHTANITGYAAYAVGDAIIFKIQDTINPANPTLQANALAIKNLLKQDGTAFKTNELRQGVQVTATYDGTDFIADISREPRSLKTQFLATATLPAGTHNDATPFTWTLESGITIVSVQTAPAGLFQNYLLTDNVATANAIIQLPSTRNTNANQIGWYLEVSQGNTVVWDKLVPFGDYSETGETIPVSSTIEFTLNHWKPNRAGSPVTYPIFLVTSYGHGEPPQTVIPAGTGYQIKLFSAEN